MPDLRCYEELIAAQSEQFEWPEFDERSGAALCYTSGTTGNPKGAMYSHRSMVLNAMTICAPGLLSLCSKETIFADRPPCSTSMVGASPYAALIGGCEAGTPGPAFGRRRTVRIDGSRTSHRQRGACLRSGSGWLQYLEQHQLRFASYATHRLRRVGHPAHVDRDPERPVRHRGAARLGG